MPINHPLLARRVFAVALVSTSALALFGCANAPSNGSASASPDISSEALVKRAQAYWDLVRSNDKVGAWPYEAASKAPNASIEGYIKKGGITYSVVRVLGVKDQKSDLAVLDVEMTYSLPLLRVRDRELRTDDQWKLIDGVWYHAPPASGLFPSK